MVLEKVHNEWTNNTEKTIEFADNLTKGVQQPEIEVNFSEDVTFNSSILTETVDKWKEQFDNIEGGARREQNKFPLPNNYQFLLSQYFHTKDEKTLEAVTTTLDNMATILKANPTTKMKLGGYTDNTGDAANNVELSKARAEAVKARLMGQGVDGSRIGTAGLGSANPVGSNDTPDGRAQNRRIEVRISK